MILKASKDIKFTYFYKRLNILSLIFIIFSVLILLLKGLNLGVDFKGGTLIELRTQNPIITIAEIRESFLKMNLGDVTVKKFGKEKDYLVKIEKYMIHAFAMGYQRAQSAVLDANITTLISAIILFFLGSGPVKGFAITLGIGILTTLFSAYFFARHLSSIYVMKNKDKQILI